MLTGCVTTGPKGSYVADSGRSVGPGEAVVAVCRKWDLGLHNSRLLSVSINGITAASLVGGTPVEVIVEPGRNRLTATISGMIVDIGKLDTEFVSKLNETVYYTVEAIVEQSLYDRKLGMMESYVWRLSKTNASDFSKSCPEKAVRVRKN